MTRSLYIATTAPGSGKSLVLLGVMQLLSSQVERVGIFRPIIRSADRPDEDVELVRERYCANQPYETAHAASHDEAREMIASGQSDKLLKRVFGRFRDLQEKCDFVVCEGTDYSRIASPFDFDFDAHIAAHIGCPVLAVANGRGLAEEEVVSLARLTREGFSRDGCEVTATILNRVKPEICGTLRARFDVEWEPSDPVFVLPEHETLAIPTVGEVFRSLSGTVIQGYPEWLTHDVRDTRIAAVNVTNFLDRVKEGSLIITPGDRSDIILGGMATVYSENCPTIVGMILTGGFELPPSIIRVLSGLQGPPLPIMSVTEDAFDTAMLVSQVDAAITPDNDRKVAAALGIFEDHVDIARLRRRVEVTRSTRVTPIMFEYDLLERARKARQHIVLPEGEEERILHATEILLRRGVAEVTLLGNEAKIRELTSSLDLDLKEANIIDPTESELLQPYADAYFELRKHKGITKDFARDMMRDVSYFGTMMVHLGDADGMVSGADHTTAHTIRPAFEFIRARPDCSIVSSVFLMCLADRVLVYGDCAVNPKPTAAQLADIAISSAATAETFGVEPRVAMLSYSTGKSGTGEDVEKVREATRIARELRPDLLLEGPIQYDAAIDARVAKSKMPGSEVAGHATVFIFPDLNTGNNTYKAVQRSAGAIAIGPVLQGLNKPVNDLSRGCLVPDIVNTVALTAVQAVNSR